MKYKLGETIWEPLGMGAFYCDDVKANLSYDDLIIMGAKEIEEPSTCGKCGERECEHEYHTTKHGYTFCTHCGKSEPKEEKIEMPEYNDRSNYTIASYHNEVVTGTPEFIKWMQAVTNKLNKGDN